MFNPKGGQSQQYRRNGVLVSQCLVKVNLSFVVLLSRWHFVILVLRYLYPILRAFASLSVTFLSSRNSDILCLNSPSASGSAISALDQSMVGICVIDTLVFVIYP